MKGIIDNMISFGIYETLITRKTYSSKGTFLIVEEKMRELLQKKDCKFLCDNFSILREKAEREARLFAEKEQNEELTLLDIYTVLSKMEYISDELISEIMEIEIEAEIENSYPIKKNIEKLKNYLLQGENVILISDTYYSEKVIRKILTNIDDIFGNIPIYLSSEYKKTKRFGSLFLEIKEKENISLKKWIHFGANEQLDYYVPRLLGIDARKVKTISLLPWEEDISCLVKKNHELIWQKKLGISKIIREEYELNSIGQIGSSIGGFILYPYVYWILEKCVKKEIIRLYFIARDGYILKKIADIIIKNKHLNINTKIIYGSREAWKEKQKKEKIEILIEYMNQEIDISDDRFAFVDLHGTGNSLENLCDFYFVDKKIIPKAFYFDLIQEKQFLSFEAISFSFIHTGFIELFGRAPYGVTIGYKKNSKIEPQFKNTNKEAWNKAGLDDYISGIEKFSEKMSQISLEGELYNSDLVEIILNYCINFPDRKISDFFGDIPHNDENHEENSVYAPKLSNKEIFNIFMWKTTEELQKYYKGANLEYSIKRFDEKEKKLKKILEDNYFKVPGNLLHKMKHLVKRTYISDNRKKKVIIYGAGKMGKKLYCAWKYSDKYNVVAWTDIKCEEYIKLGYPLKTLEEIMKIKFDWIIVAIKNEFVNEKASLLLEAAGIERKKIKSFLELTKNY